MQGLLFFALRGAYILRGLPKLTCRTVRSRGETRLLTFYSRHCLVLYIVAATMRWPFLFFLAVQTWIFTERFRPRYGHDHDYDRVSEMDRFDLSDIVTVWEEALALVQGRNNLLAFAIWDGTASLPLELDLG